MRIEILLFIVAGFLIANIYTDGKYTKLLYGGKKYYQMAGIAFATLMIYILLKKNPLRAREIVSASNDYIKYLPIDKNTSNLISPILDFTSKGQYYGGDGGSDTYTYNNPIIKMNQGDRSERTMMQSGKNSTKRSVSETKKKFVAARQNWTCMQCKQQLSAWFEVDHIKRLEYGGSNHIDNLRALCRECHASVSGLEHL